MNNQMEKYSVSGVRWPVKPKRNNSNFKSTRIVYFANVKYILDRHMKAHTQPLLYTKKLYVMFCFTFRSMRISSTIRRQVAP